MAGLDVDLNGKLLSPDDEQPRRIEFCTGKYLREALRCAAATLERHVEEIDALNVFPVPDGDTGTNMYMTMQAAVGEVEKLTDPTLGAVIQAAAHGALMGARGNSGVILSQIFRGMARSLDRKRVASPRDLAQAFAEASATARRGVMKPVEGTILTVARDVVDATAAAAAGGGDVREVMQAAVEAASDSVARTPSLLPVLQEAGVVDAGGQGLLVILKGVLRAFAGEEMSSYTPAAVPVVRTPMAESGYGYCTEFLLKGNRLDVGQIRARIAEMGDSVLVVGEPTMVRVHVHSLSPGRIIDYATGLGSLHQIKIDNMQEQHQNWFEERSATGAPEVGQAGVNGREPGGRATDVLWETAAQQRVVLNGAGATGISVIAISPGPGLGQVLASLGATVVSGGQTMNPSTRELLDAVQRCPTDQVIILPNNSNIVLTAQQVRALSEKEVAVVPTETVPQGIAALMGFRFEADLEANVRRMSQAASTVDTLEVTRAVRSSVVDGLKVRKGELIGLLNGRLMVTGKAHEQIVNDLIFKARGDDRPWEIATVYYGSGVKESHAKALAESLRRRHKHREVELVKGEQPYYDYIVSIE